MLNTGYRFIDLNADMGEGIPGEEGLMPLVSSVNIACGEHAGDPAIMHKTLRLAMERGVAIGAHPSYPDREHFGRVDLIGTKALYPEDLPGLILRQLISFREICVSLGARMHHVKLHGALYNRAATDPAVAMLFCQTLCQFDDSLLVYGLSGSQLAMAAARQGLEFVHEVFADRTYMTDGRLTPRTEPHALIEDPDLAVRQVLGMVKDGSVRATSGETIFLRADTICLHGDGRHALDHAKAIRHALEAEQVGIRPPAFPK